MTRSTSHLTGWLSLLLVLSASTAAAQGSSTPLSSESNGETAATSADGASSTAARTLGARMRLLRDVAADLEDGDDAALSDLPRSLERGGAHATLRFEEELDDATLDALRELGLDFERHRGDVLHVGPIYQAFVPWNAFDALRHWEGLIRVESTWAPTHLEPLNETSRLVGARRVRRKPSLDYGGEGVTIADVDSGFDIYHPHLFRADGGYYDWLDVNGNDTFDPGTDGVDLDGDGRIQNNERLKVLDAALYTRGGVKKRNGTLEPGRDWLYVDRNQNGKRDVGPQQFNESTPAYGEPTFVADDVDDDGQLEPLERLARLDSSKFKKIVEDDRTYERGKDLIEFGIPGRDDRSYHGTGVTSVLAGGQPGFHDRIGLAPEAELVGYPYTNQSRGRGFRQKIRYVKDAMQSNIDIMLHEWSRIALAPLDGSSNLEATMDRSRKQSDLLQVTPLGNLNQSKKHLERTVSPNTKTTFDFVVGNGYTRRGQTRPYRLLYATLQWKNQTSPDIELTDPKGNTFTLSGSSQRGTIGQTNVYVRPDSTTRGTEVLTFYLRNRSSSLKQGTWTIEVTNASSQTTIYGRVADRYSGWDVGIKWKNPTKDRGTLTYPSTADAGFGVAAFGARRTRGGRSKGELRRYSGRGPRVGGARAVDIAAPADPLVAFGINQRYAQRGIPHSWFRIFGGTSGAGPHVAASLALLAEQHPQWGPDKLESRITASADTNNLSPDLGPVPNADWGHGKLNAYRAVTKQAKPPAGKAPKAALDVDQNGKRITLDASASSDPDGDPLEYRFDIDYDGEWETPWRSGAIYRITESAYSGTRLYTARVAVRDDRGERDEALGPVNLISIVPPPGDVGLGDTGTPDVGASDAGSPDAPSRDVHTRDAVGPDGRAGDGGTADATSPVPDASAPSDDASMDGGDDLDDGGGTPERDVANSTPDDVEAPDDAASVERDTSPLNDDAEGVDASSSDAASQVDGTSSGADARDGFQVDRDGEPSNDGCGCRAADSTTPPVWWGLALAGVLWVGRRRRS